MSEYIKTNSRRSRYFSPSKRVRWLHRSIERFWTLTDFEYGAPLAFVLIFLQLGLIRIACIASPVTRKTELT